MNTNNILQPGQEVEFTDLAVTIYGQALPATGRIVKYHKETLGTFEGYDVDVGQEDTTFMFPSEVTPINTPRSYAETKKKVLKMLNWKVTSRKEDIEAAEARLANAKREWVEANNELTEYVTWYENIEKLEVQYNTCTETKAQVNDVLLANKIPLDLEFKQQLLMLEHHTDLDSLLESARSNQWLKYQTNY